jgi:hypothetical protein
VGCAFSRLVKSDVRVVCGAAGELNFQIAVQRGLVESGLRQPEAHSHDGKLGAARGLEHVEVAVGIPGVKRLDRHGDEEVALPGVTDALPARGVDEASRGRPWRLLWQRDQKAPRQRHHSTRTPKRVMSSAA